MNFEIKGPIRNIQIIARGRGIRNLKRLIRFYGKAHWRKLKGSCMVECEDGAILQAEIHWYEGHGIGKREIKIKRYL